MSGAALLTERLEAAVREHERRARAGEAVDLDAFCAEFANLAPHLRRELEVHAMLGQLAERPVLEQIGAELGDYQLVEEIGRGGMGAVFRARDRVLGRDVAIKVVAIDPLRPERAERLLREARAIARIRHPNVVEVHAFGRTERWMYLVMELLCGTLAERMAPDPGDPDRIATVRRWMLEAAQGLAHCHDHGIVHRDIKPENLLVDAGGSVAVADFGLARAEDLVRITETGHVLGTLGYSAPELLRGEPADVRSDVYALGACLHALLAGQPPPRTPAPWRALPGSTPPALRALVARAMAPDRAERLTDAHAFAAALRAGGVDPRRRRLPVLAAAVGIAGIAGALVWTSSDGPRAAAPPAAAVTDPGPPPAGGFVLAEFERWVAENQPPAAAEQAPGASPSPVDVAWERRLRELSRVRELSRARAVEFEDGGTTYVAQLATRDDGIVVTLERGETVRARIELGREQLAGHPDGWGIYFDTADEDGDGHKELALVRADDQLVSIRLLKLDPQAWLARDQGWRRAPAPDARFGAPSFRRTGDRWEVQALELGGASGEAPALATFALESGASLAPRRAIDDLHPRGPRLLDDDGRLWIDVGDAEALVAGPEAITWRWRSSTRGAAPISSWRALRLHDDGGWAAVALDVDGIALAGLAATTLAPVAGEPHLRHLLAGAHPPAISRRAAGGPAACAAGGDTIACVAHPGGGAARLRWQVRLAAGARVTHPPAELADLDGDGLGELAGVSAAGRLYIVSARDGGTIVAEHDLAGPPSAPPVWLAPERCLVVATPSRLACASVDGDRIALRTIADVEYRYDRYSGVRRIAARRAGSPASLLVVTIDYGYHRGVQVIDPRGGAEPRLWRYATGSDPVPAPAVQVHDGRLWIAFADRAGALHVVPARLPDELVLE